MIFTETKLKGAFTVDIERREDNRGFFARAFCQREFENHGLKPVIAQANIAFNKKKGTLRGMHFQYPPAPETKLVRCTRGAILDIIVDLRPESPTTWAMSPSSLAQTITGPSMYRSGSRTGTRFSRIGRKRAIRWENSIRPAPKAACSTAIPGLGWPGLSLSEKYHPRMPSGPCSPRSNPS